MYVAIDPKSGKPKEYANSAEFFKEVEEFTAKEPERQREVKTFADASDRIRDELGLDTRTPAEIKAAADNEYIEERIAEGVSAALEQAQKAEKAQQAEKAEKVSLSPWPVIQKHSKQPRYKFFDRQECGCKAEGHRPKAEPTIHSRRGVGPTMTARGLNAAEAEKRLAARGQGRT